MAKNKLQDLNNHLFAQLERLNDETIKPEEMKSEIEKAKAMEGIAKVIIETNKVETDKAKLMLDAFDRGFIKEIDTNKILLLE
ncbi:hypothetical protein J2X97_000364 [Epilithonimonas hungarica]|uniref:hypothetical protein n=1 Tax=Epilithonimonas hungarica TaxID=454006 RepID=UPI0027842032|nr:hypothetical protein [Epilithonimonas hungarica]MDP9954727.1 hypothetical protein [Epilithonimonas hungarica]